MRKIVDFIIIQNDYLLVECGWGWLNNTLCRSIYRKSWILKMILGCWSTFWILSESPFCDCQKPCGSRGSNFVKFDEDFVICCFSISNNPEQTGQRKARLYYHRQVIYKLVWSDITGPDHHISVRMLKSSSNWTKSSMMGPQLFLGWYQMILDVLRCSD